MAHVALSIRVRVAPSGVSDILMVHARWYYTYGLYHYLTGIGAGSRKSPNFRKSKVVKILKPNAENPESPENVLIILNILKSNARFRN
jgi:hypothetical protein